MSLLTVDELRALVPSPLGDGELFTLIEWVEAEMEDAIGGPYVDASTSLTERLEGGGESLFLKRRIGSVTTVREYATLTDSSGALLTQGADFFLWPKQGRLQRLGNGVSSGLYRPEMPGCWGAYVDVSYVPQDDNARRKIATVDLVRLVLSQTALKSESVAGEYSYQAPANWEEEKRRILRRIAFLGV